MKRLDRIARMKRISMDRAEKPPQKSDAERKADNIERLGDATNRLSGAVQRGIDNKQSTQICLTIHLRNGEIVQSDVLSEETKRYAR